MRTIKFYTLGCKVNQYDTESIRQRFINAGFCELYNGRPADVCLINTCTVTQTADTKSRELIRRISRQNPGAKLIVTGCLAEKDTVFLKDIGRIDYIIPKKFFPDGTETFSAHTRAFLKIQDGCDNFCSFCKVPYVRGRSRSRSFSEIINEAEKLAEGGFKEIVLCGICLGAYGKDLAPKLDLVNLLEEIEKISGVLRIRLSSIEPGDVGERLIEKIASSKKLCPHLHIPLQSGDDNILKKMNRGYSQKDYLNLIWKIRRNIPEIAITTDVLAGFPMESQENFQNTLDTLREILPLRTHIFSYSRREVTSAAKNFKSGVPSRVIKERARYLAGVAGECSLNYRRRFLNREVSVLFENRLNTKPYSWQGYTDTYIKVLLEADCDLKNKIIKVNLVRVTEDISIGGKKFPEKYLFDTGAYACLPPGRATCGVAEGLPGGV